MSVSQRCQSKKGRRRDFDSPCVKRYSRRAHRKVYRMSAEDETTKADNEDVEKVSPDKPNITLPGTVEKIIPAIGSEPEKAQITVEGADDLYREVRIENALQDADGDSVGLKKGAEVDVTIEADAKDTKPKD